ncbi:TPA: hypothetical protein ACOQ43_005554 [Bacillus cereus]|uniref:hypothetical protein n=1 Tax=Bacillus paranthracis TaxID=2026186 RepID=UPI002FDBE5E5
MHTFYKIDTNIEVNRTLEKPYVLHVRICYFNDEFKQRIQNMVKIYEPAFEIKYKNFITKYLQKEHFKIKLVSYRNKEVRALRTGHLSHLINVEHFDFENDMYAFLKRNEAEEAMHKMKEAITEILNKEAQFEFYIKGECVMKKIRVTFNMSSGESRSTNLDVKDLEEAQKKIYDNFLLQRTLNKGVLYHNADHQEGNVFEVNKEQVVCIDYEETE